MREQDELQTLFQSSTRKLVIKAVNRIEFAYMATLPILEAGLSKIPAITALQKKVSLMITHKFCV